MPVYNGEKYLSIAIESILNQTFDDFEFLIMDDGSRDGSRDIVEKYAKQDARIRVFEQKNSGIVKSLNTLIEKAQAPLLARMDSDDIALPQRFEKQYAYFEKHPEAVLVGCRYEIFGDLMIYKILNIIKAFRKMVGAKAGSFLRLGLAGSRSQKVDASGSHFSKQQLGGGLPWGEPAVPPMSFIQFGDTFQEDFFNRWFLTINPPFKHPEVMMKKETVLKAGGYRPQFFPAEDYDLWIRLKRYGTISSLSETLMCIRRSSSSISATNYIKQLNVRDRLNRVNFEDIYKHGEIPSIDAIKQTLQHYHFKKFQKETIAKLACITGCFLVEKGEFERAVPFFQLAKSYSIKRIDAVYNLLFGKGGKAILIAVDCSISARKAQVKVHRFTK